METPETPKTPLSLGQKILFALLCALLLLMLLFSLLALRHQGAAGYDRCIAQKCAAHGDEYCTKAREISNCCLGAAGEVAQTQRGLECVFP